VEYLKNIEFNNKINCFYYLHQLETNIGKIKEVETEIFTEINEPSLEMKLSPMSQFTRQVLELQIKDKEKIEKDERIYVGELHEKWQFPSDHLPIGIKVENFKVISWNVLNNAYLDWVIQKDSQGLNGSMISELNIEVENGLTERDQRVIDMIYSMIKHSSFYSTGLVSLQECGAPFLEKLSQNLPTNWGIVKKSTNKITDEDVILYNKDLFFYRSDLSEVIGCYPTSQGRTLLNAVFERLDGSEKIIRILNAHVPGDPNLPGKEEFAKYVYEQKKANPKEIMIALGDHNFERKEILDAYQKAGFDLSEFDFYSPWNTNIDPYTKEAKGIDHIFVQGAKSTSLSAEEIMEGYHFKETIELLSK
jgi:hypothetical protein